MRMAIGEDILVTGAGGSSCTAGGEHVAGGLVFKCRCIYARWWVGPGGLCTSEPPAQEWGERDRQCRVRTACCRPGSDKEAVVGGERLLLGTAVMTRGRPSRGASVNMAIDEGTGVAGAVASCIAGDEKAGGLVLGASVLMKGE